MSRPHIVIATPCFGGVVTHNYMMSVLRLTQWAGTAAITTNVLMLGGDSLISRARSVLVAHFLATAGATHLLFIDSDIAFDVESLQRMLDVDRDFVAGLYPLKTVDWKTLPLHAVKGEPLPQAGLSYVGQPCTGSELRVEDGFVTGVYAGTGFQLIKRSVFERMIRAYPETKFRAVHAATNQQAPEDHLYALFDCIIDPDSGAYLSEDYAFCRRWRALGGEIFLDLQSRLTHTGPTDFVGDAAARFSNLMVPATAPILVQAA